ncbi:MAG: hypothetical protein EON55_08200 [Alphaproteobacteria bacterium]|nr:MAG: hypothetical protein EON55_08200 [Alphaproteobacteria bacterium]
MRTTTLEAAFALMGHLARRCRGAGTLTLSAHGTRTTPMFREVASRLALGRLESNPGRAADQLLAACAARGASIVVPTPERGTWDRAVAVELACRFAELAASTHAVHAGAAAPRGEREPGTRPQVFFVGASLDDDDDLAGDRYDVDPALDDGERQRFWLAVAEDASRRVKSTHVADLERVWAEAERVAFASRPASHASSHASAWREAPPSDDARALFEALRLVGRDFPEREIRPVLAEIIERVATEDAVFVGISLHPIYDDDGNRIRHRWCPQDRARLGKLRPPRYQHV